MWRKALRTYVIRIVASKIVEKEIVDMHHGHVRMIVGIVALMELAKN